MRLKALVTSLILLIGCDNTTSEDYHLQANTLEKEGKYEEAILLLDKAIKKDPNNIKALLDRAVDQSLLANYDEALIDYTQVIALDSNNTLAYFNRGKNYHRIENYKAAIADFEKAITLKGGMAFYIDKIENSFLENGFEYDVAMEEIRLERGVSRYYLNSLQLAFDDFNFCIQNKYELPTSYLWRGLVYLTYEMHTEGCKDLNEALRLGNSDAEDLLNKNCK